MDPAEQAVRGFWEAMDRRDWDRAAALLDPAVVVDWPQSGERIRGRANVLAINQAYPGAWRLEVQRAVASGSSVAAHVRIPIDGRVEHCAGFYEIRGGRIARAVELWSEPFPPAAWRAAWVEAGGAGPG